MNKHQVLFGLVVTVIAGIAFYFILLAAGVLKKDDGAKPIPQITFVDFEITGEWCIPTRYAVAPAVGSSVRSDSTPDVFSLTGSNPKFSATYSSTGMRWFRAVAPSYVWRDHVMTRRSDGTFVDESNPCPDIVTVEFIGFQRETRPGAPAWCYATTYRAAYGSRSSTVDVDASETGLNPMLSITPDIPVEWFKQGNNGEWVAHSMTRVADRAGVYVDEVNGCDAPTIEFMGVTMPSPYNMPWLMPTRYCAAFTFGGRIGPVCSPSDVVFSTTHVQPTFKIENDRSGVHWYRAVAPDFQWQEHEMYNNTQGVYSDLQTVPIPTPPAPTGNGLYDNKWNRVADETYVPWLLPSRYRVRYVYQEYASDWSEYTEDYVSDQYTTPSLKAEPGPADIFQVEWEACGSYITLPPSNNYHQTFKMTFDGIQVFGISVPFGLIGAGGLIMPLAAFVHTWNSSDVGPYPWPMNLLPDGRLQLIVVKGGGVPGTNFWLIHSPSYNEWWPLMGFDSSAVWQLEEPITATESVAISNCVSRFGLEFVDDVLK